MSMGQVSVVAVRRRAVWGGMLGHMRFTEHELTAALTGAAKTVLAAQRRDVRKGKRDIDSVWDELDRYQRFKVLDALGDQLLPVLVALPDVEVAAGTRPTFTDQQVTEAVEGVMGEGKGLRRKVELTARVALVQSALASVPPRIDPDALVVPDHL
jgi:hypothetical protein